MPKWATLECQSQSSAPLAPVTAFPAVDSSVDSWTFSRISAPIQRLGSGALVLDFSLFVEYKSGFGFLTSRISEEA